MSTRRRAAKKTTRKKSTKQTSKTVTKRTSKKTAQDTSAKKSTARKKVSRKKAEQVEVEIQEPTKEEASDLVGVLSELRGITKKLNRTSSMVCSDEEFRDKVEHIKTMCPPPKRCKVKVSRVSPEEMTEEHGYVTKHRDQFEIVIANNLTEYETTHVLLHEWAHMLAWRPYHPLQGDHGGDWGVWYANIWRQYFGVQ